jgi:hypothetical protein
MLRTLLVAAVAPLVFVLLGCNDLGTCTDPQQGRVPVLTAAGSVMYAGQAILSQSCANGCHSSVATGGLRVGAPKELDFDLNPLTATGTITVESPEGPQIVGTTDDGDAMSGLRRRQRKVFDLRELIWEQVQDGLMPPSGVGASFKSLSPGNSFTSAGMGDCTRVEPPYAGLNSSSTKKVLQQWLACGAPIVEMNSNMIPKPVGGTVGDQYPACEEDLPPTFENVYSAVFEGGGCTAMGCHGMGAGVQAGFDLNTIDIAYMEMVGDGTGADSTCVTEPGGPLQKMVVPGDPDASYILTKLGEPVGVLCGLVMPPTGVTLPADRINLLREWIMVGAPAPGEGEGDGT